MPAVAGNSVLAERTRVSALFLLRGVIFSTWASRIPSVQASLRLSTGLLGLLLLCNAAGSIASMPPAGILVARCGSRIVVRLSSICFGIALLGLAISASAVQFAIALFFFGAAGGCMNVSMNQQAILVESLAQKPLMSSFHALFSMGAMLGTFAGGLAAEDKISVQQHLIVAAAILCTGVWLASRKVMDGAIQPTRTSRNLLLQTAQSILPLAMIAFCAGLSEGAMADWIGVYLHTELLTSLGRAALGYSAFSFAMVAGRIAGDRVTHALGSQRCIRVGYILGAAGLSVSLVTHVVPATITGFACVGLGLSVVIPNVFRIATHIKGVASAYGVAAVTATAYLGILTSPPVIGGLAQLSSLRLALVFVVMAMALGVALSRRGLQTQSNSVPENCLDESLCP